MAGLYAAGEAAGTFGVYRPGGSALNSTQVGALRAAEHIAGKAPRATVAPCYRMPKIRYGCGNVAQLKDALQREMSRVADFDRSTAGMQALFEKVSALCEDFFNTVTADNEQGHAELFRLFDMLLSQRAVLSAMICTAREIGTHGAALVDRAPARENAVRQTRTLTKGGDSRIAGVSPIPSPELWFETLLAKKKRELGNAKRI